MRLLVLLLVACPGSLAADRPNIVFMLIDDMGWPDVACYGHRFHETPVIDRLARDGMKFTDFYAATPVCSSSRSTIMTGQYSARTGVTDFIPGHWRPFEKLVVPKIDHHLQDGVKTPGDVLTAAGYATGYFGKWHLGTDAAHQPDQHGFAVTERKLPGALKPKKPERGPKSIDYLTDAALWFIDQNKSRPFFLTVSHHAVHIPLESTKETAEKYRRKTPPEHGVNNPIYAAMIEDLDNSIGRVLAKLEEHKLANNTIIVFTSDNGGLRQIYTKAGDIVSSNAPLRDEKGTLYEGGIRVPMIVRWPGVVAAGTVCDEPTTTADLLPTFCEMASTATPKQPIDGSSMVPLLKDANASLSREAIYFHYPHYHHSRPGGAIRKGNWKLIEWFEDDSVELYNLADDLSESKNLAADEPRLVAALKADLAAFRMRTHARMPTLNPNFDAAKADQWWSRRTNKPLDVEAMRKRYRTRQKNPAANRK
jgi:uncharacterized sulfatase